VAQRKRRGGSKSPHGSVPTEPEATARAEVRNASSNTYLNNKDVQGELVGEPSDEDQLPTDRAEVASLAAFFDGRRLRLDVRDAAGGPIIALATSGLFAAGVGIYSEKTAATAAVTHDAPAQHIAEAGLGLAGLLTLTGSVIAALIVLRRKR
jgi:hypothetical protein